MARQESCRVAGKVECATRDFFRLAVAPHGGSVDHMLEHAIVLEDCARQLGVDEPRRDGVDEDFRSGNFGY
jgi:hypothetical protein